MRTVIAQNTAAVNLLLEHGATVNASDLAGCTSLHHASSLCKEPDILHLLIERDANLNTQNVLGQAPLHCAAAMFNPNAANLLLKAGARSDVASVSEHSARSLLETLGILEIAGFLEQDRGQAEEEAVV
ncbi:ankyrin repeat-containing domain protein [Aspergillus oleicola]